MGRKRIAVVTGASGGMGREFAVRISKTMDSLDEIWLIARREDRLHDTARKMEVSGRCFAMDISNSYDLRELEVYLKEEKPEIRMLVNCAGFGIMGDCDVLTAKEQHDMIAVNCQALVEMTHMMIPYMPVNGRIIQVASVAAFYAQPGFAVYAASKAFVLSYSRALAHELKEQGIAVTIVCPGPVKTEFFDTAIRYEKQKFMKRMIMAKPEKVVKRAIHDSYFRKELSVYGLASQLIIKISPFIPKGIVYRFLGR